MEDLKIFALNHKYTIAIPFNRKTYIYFFLLLDTQPVLSNRFKCDIRQIAGKAPADA